MPSSVQRLNLKQSLYLGCRYDKNFKGIFFLIQPGISKNLKKYFQKSKLLCVFKYFCLFICESFFLIYCNVFQKKEYRKEEGESYMPLMDDSELLKLEISENENPFFGLAGDILASPGKGNPDDDLADEDFDDEDFDDEDLEDEEVDSEDDDLTKDFDETDLEEYLEDFEDNDLFDEDDYELDDDDDFDDDDFDDDFGDGTTDPKIDDDDDDL